MLEGIYIQIYWSNNTFDQNYSHTDSTRNCKQQENMTSIADRHCHDSMANLLTSTSSQSHMRTSGAVPRKICGVPPL